MDTKFSCNQCDKFFANKSGLVGHTLWKHNPTFTELCSKCGRRCKSANLSRHQKRCEQPKRTCDECGAETRNPTFCSRRCASRVHNREGKTGYKRWHVKNGKTKILTFRDLCFSIWERKCAICSWDISVDVHHIDNDQMRVFVPDFRIDTRDNRSLIMECKSCQHPKRDGCEIWKNYQRLVPAKKSALQKYCENNGLLWAWFDEHVDHTAYVLACKYHKMTSRQSLTG